MNLPLLFLLAWSLLRADDRPIAIGRETQLFLDDFTVDWLTRVKRVLHPPDKKGLVKDEEAGDFGTGGVYLGNIVYRDGKGLFHMLYRYQWDDPSVAPLHPSIGEDKAHWFRELTGYATSADGIRWKKPRAGVTAAPIDFALDLQMHGNVADPKKRFLFRVTRKDDTHAFAKVVEQQLAFGEEFPDLAGDANWRSKLHPIPDGKLSPRGFLTLAGYDDAAKVWFQVCQGKVLDWSKREGREIVRYESPDLVHWTGPEVVLPIQPDEPKDSKDYVEYMDLDGYRVGGSPPTSSRCWGPTPAGASEIAVPESWGTDQQWAAPVYRRCSSDRPCPFPGATCVRARAIGAAV